jgi:hypothetical protein
MSDVKPPKAASAADELEGLPSTRVDRRFFGNLSNFGWK